VTALDRLVERRGRARAARQFARWRTTNLIDQTIDRSDGRRINSAGQRLLTAFIDVRDKVIVCDGVSVSGGIARLDSFVSLAQEHDAVVYVDDAHGIGVLGSRLGALPLGHGGAGSPAFCGVRAGNHVHVGGLSKAFGVPVAFVAGPERFTDYLRLTASASMASAYRSPASP
jgi:7-keto-8-aminopelargonate synthetase-like enzyme